MKRTLAILLCVSMMLVICSPLAFADAGQPDDAPGAGYDEEYGEDPADAEDPYLGGNTIYDLENEVDAEPVPDELPPPENTEPGDDESEIYGNDSFDAENSSQLSSGEYVLDEIIIKFKEPGQVPGKEKQLQHEIEKVEKVGLVESLGLYVVKAEDLEKNPNAVLNRFKNNKYIEYVEPNYKIEFELTPNDPSYGIYQTAAMNLLNAPAGWDIIKGSSNAIIAVIDSGIIQHPDLPPLYSGYSALAGLSWTNDKVGHGTSVAGVIGAIGNNGIGVAGLNWNASIMSVKVDDSAGILSIASVANGIIWAANNGAKIINISLGTTADSATLKNAIDYAYNKGCAIFAATGNAGAGSVDYPARYSNVMAVGSYSGGSRAPTSNYGSGLNVLGLSSFYTTQKTGAYGSSGGTSFSAPQAAALASLLWAVNPKLTNAGIYDLIQRGASGNGKYINNEMGYGLIDFGKTLQLALSGAGTTPPETPPPVRTAPTITLTGFTSLSLEYGQAYQEMGYAAADCMGLNLTSSVKVTSNIDVWKAGIYTVTYEVSDSGFTTRATRTVTVKPKPADPPAATAPKITIIGSNPIILHATSSTPYTEQRARAVDYNGNDISSLVTVSGTINRTTPGTYTLTYRVTSPVSGLSATATRNVRIVSPTEKRDPRTVYGFSGQAKQGGKITHTGIVAAASGFMDLRVSSIDKNMSIGVELVDTVTKKVVVKDTYTAAGTKQYRIDKAKYDLVVTVNQANGNSKYALELTMPEVGPTLIYDIAEVPLFGLPQVAPRGSNPIILHIGGTPYTEQGARAVDRYGNDISAAVTVDGAPDTGKAGTYVVTYTVICEITGIPVRATREVRVYDPSDESTILPDEIPLGSLPEQAPGTEMYVVIAGDSLWKISQKYYGTGLRWYEIYDLNEETIGPNPGMIKIGQVLVIRI